MGVSKNHEQSFSSPFSITGIGTQRKTTKWARWASCISNQKRLQKPKIIDLVQKDQNPKMGESQFQNM